MPTRRMQRKEAEAKAQLAKNVAQLRATRIGISLNWSRYIILSLSTCIQSMGKVKTTFNQVATHWQAVAANCEMASLYGKDFHDNWESVGEMDDDCLLEWQN